MSMTPAMVAKMMGQGVVGRFEEYPEPPRDRKHRGCSAASRFELRDVIIFLIKLFQPPKTSVPKGAKRFNYNYYDGNVKRDAGFM